MKSYLSVFLVIFALLASGCIIHVEDPYEYEDYPSDGPVVEEYERPVNNNFDARIKAAKSMMNFMQQDAALSSIAQDAAKELDIEHTLKALSLINNFMTQDSTAEECVTPFINENMINEANMIADEINNFMTKDNVLVRIAQGPQ